MRGAVCLSFSPTVAAQPAAGRGGAEGGGSGGAGRCPPLLLRKHRGAAAIAGGEAGRGCSVPAVAHDWVRAQSRIPSALGGVATRREYSLPRAAGCGPVQRGRAVRRVHCAALQWGRGRGRGASRRCVLRRSSGASSEQTPARPRRGGARPAGRGAGACRLWSHFPFLPGLPIIPSSPLPADNRLFKVWWRRQLW